MRTRSPFERDLCASCNRWREEHYDNQGNWLTDQPCSEYQGVTPSPDRLKKKEKEIAYLTPDEELPS